MGWFGCALLAGVVALPLSAGTSLARQGRERDAGAFVVTVNGAVVGREEFSIREGRAGSRDGFTVTSRRLSGDGDVTLAATTELGPDSQPVAAQLAEPKAERRTYIELSPRRITVRAVTPVGESVREYPGGTPLWLADPGVLAWFAMLPPVGTGRLTVLWPRENRCETWEIADRGVEPAPPGSDSKSLRHIVLGTAPNERHLWYDDAGRLRKLEDPTGLQAVRAAH